MITVPTLRAVEKVLDRLSWLTFGLGVVVMIVLCARALLGARTPAPEDFLAELGVVLAATLVPTFLFRIGSAWCRRRRAEKPRTSEILGSVSLFDDSITR
jgi:hypothetical protein